MTRARSGVLVTAVLLVAGWLVPVPASADPWRFEGGGTTPLFVNVVQSGGTISFVYKAPASRAPCPRAGTSPRTPRRRRAFPVAQT